MGDSRRDVFAGKNMYPLRHDVGYCDGDGNILFYTPFEKFPDYSNFEENLN